MSSSNIDRLVAVALIVLSAIAILLSLRFPGDAGVFPIAMACLLIITSGTLLLQSIFRDSAPKEPDEPIEVSRFLKWVGFALILFLVVQLVDFYVGVFLFIVLCYIMLAERGLIFSVTLGALFTIMLYVAFDALLGVPTPSNVQFYITWL